MSGFDDAYAAYSTGALAKAGTLAAVGVRSIRQDLTTHLVVP